MNKYYKIIIYQLVFVLILLIYNYKLINILYCNKQDPNEYKILKWCYYEDIVNEIKSGDLLLFSAYEFSKYTRIIGHLDYSHIGIILKENNILYSLEMIENDYIFPKYDKFSNMQKFNLKDRIIHYPGYIYIASYNKNLNISQETILKKISNLNFQYPSHYNNLNTILFNKDFICNINNKKCRQKNNYIHCSNLIALILYNLNIYNMKDIPNIHIHSKIIDLCNGNIYSEPIRIISKKNIINNINNNKYKNYC
jgi:hypothetical protein